MIARKFSLAFALALIAGTLVIGFADDDAKKDEKPDAADVSEKDETKSEKPVTVPEKATPAELLAFMEEQVNREPEATTRAGLEKFLLEVTTVVNQAADKLLADKSATEEQREEAYQYKVGLTAQCARFGMEGFAGKLDALAKDLRKQDPTSSLATSATYHAIHANYSRPRGFKPEVIPVIENLIKENKDHMLGLQLLNEVGEATQRTDPDVAKKAYEMAIKYYPEHPAKDMFEAFLRKMNLVGNSMTVEGKTLEGAEFNLSKLKGKVVLVDFWATWCGPCLAEIPTMKKMYEEYHDKGFEIVGISIDDEKETVDTFVKDEELPWIQVWSQKESENGVSNPIADYYGITGIPAMILIDRQGKVVSLNARGEILEELVPKLIDGKTPSAN